MPTIQTCKVKSKQPSNPFSTKLSCSREIKLQIQMYQRKKEKKTKILRNECVITRKVSIAVMRKYIRMA